MTRSSDSGKSPETGSVQHQISLGDRAPSRRDPLFVAGRVILGVVLLAACVDKIMHPDDFARVIANYQILPEWLVNPFAVVLPWLELILGILLVTGLWLSGTVVLVNVLLLSFLGALVFNVIRGLDVHCGCFSTNVQGKPDTMWYLFRDAAFLGMSGYLWLKTFFVPRKH